MGIQVNTIGNVPIDRSVMLVVIYTDDDNPDNWRILSQWQDAPYNGDKRLMSPQQNTEQVEVAFGAAKAVTLASGGTIGDLFAKVKEAVYTLRQLKADEAGPFAPPPPAQPTPPPPQAPQPEQLR